MPLCRSGSRPGPGTSVSPGTRCLSWSSCAGTARGYSSGWPIWSRLDGALAEQGQPIVCTLDADGGDMAGRLAEWQAILAQATGREDIDEGIAVTFGHDIARTADLARLLAAEYSCCSFASYHLTIDARGVRM